MNKAPDAFRTISEVADDLDIPQHVLRFWETRFSSIRPLKRGGGRRYYRPDDVDLLRGIRHLLYGQGYTIKGVQRILKDQGPRAVQGIGRGDGTASPPPDPNDFGPSDAGMEMDERDAPTEPWPLESRPIEQRQSEPRQAEPRLAEPRQDERPSWQERAAARHDHDDGDIAPGGMIMPSQDAPEFIRRHFAPAAPGMAEDQVRRLRGALADLQECRRVLDALRRR